MTKKTIILPFFALVLTLVPAQAQVTLTQARRIEVTREYDQGPLIEVFNVLAPYKSGVDSIMVPMLGESQVPMQAYRPESPLSNWAADVMVWAGRKYYGRRVDMGLVNIGGLRNNMPQGIVRRGDILLISPFNNRLALVEMKGRDLLELMQNIIAVGGEGVSAGVRISPEGITLNGRTIRENATYIISTLDYLAEGNDKMVAMKKGRRLPLPRKLAQAPLTSDCMMEYIREHGTITSRVEGRIVLPTAEKAEPRPEPRKLFVVHTNDTHSCIEPISPNSPDTAQADKAGYARRAVLLDNLRKEHPDMLLLDGGDFSQGSVYYNLYKGEVEVKLMNTMHYDAATIGNHEFDFGLENMARLFRLARFPLVCCNYDFTGTPVEGLVKPYIIVERAGMRIGILGVGPQLEGLVSASSYGATRFVDPVKAAQPVVDHLRSTEKVDVVICLSHLGWLDDGDKSFISRMRGLDLVVGAHTHTYFDAPRYVTDLDGRQVPVNQMGKNARFVGTVLLEVER